MIDVVRAELFAGRRRPAMWILGGIWLVLAVFFGMLIPVIVYHAIAGSADYTAADRAKLIDSVDPAHFVVAGVSLYPLFGSAIMLLLGVVAMGGEYRWGTLTALLTQRPGRVTTLLGKWCAVAAALLAVTVALYTVLAATSAVIAAAEGRPMHWPGLGSILGGIGASWLTSLAAAGVGMFLAVLFRSTGTAIGVGLVWLLLLENAVSGLAGLMPSLKWLQQLLIGPNAGSLAVALGSSSQSHGGIPGVQSTSSTPLAVTVLLAYLVLFVGLSAVLMRRRDVP
jgi:ABC-type transport system involved in multi-copper enzyme maturation permease subunit